MKGTPWEPEPGIDSTEVRARLRAWGAEDAEGPRIPEGVVRPRRKHRTWITRDDVDRFGPTEGCRGCRRALQGEENVGNHSEKCRTRMTSLKEGTPNYDEIVEAERLWKQEDRANRIIEDQEVELEDEDIKDDEDDEIIRGEDLDQLFFVEEVRDEINYLNQIRTHLVPNQLEMVCTQ